MIIRVTNNFSELIFHKLLVLTRVNKTCIITEDYTSHYTVGQKVQTYIQEVYK